MRVNSGGGGDRDAILHAVKVRLRVPPVDDPDFVVETELGETAVLRLVGSADTAAVEPLGQLLSSFHGELTTAKTPELVLDVRSLDHMSASCLKPLLGWLQSPPSETRYRIRIRINPVLPWQQNLRALSCFDTSLITIET